MGGGCCVGETFGRNVDGCGFEIFYIHRYIYIYIWYTVYIYIYIHTFFWKFFVGLDGNISKSSCKRGETPMHLNLWDFRDGFFRRVCWTSWQITILNRRYIDSNGCSSILMSKKMDGSEDFPFETIPAMNLPGVYFFRLFLVACWYDYDLSWWVSSKAPSPLDLSNNPRRSPDMLWFLDGWT